MDNQTHCEQDIDFDRGAFCFGPNDVCLFLSSSGALYLNVSREINEKKLQATREDNYCAPFDSKNHQKRLMWKRNHDDDDGDMLEWVRGDNRLGAGDHYVPHFPVNKRASHLRAHYTPRTLTRAHSQYTQKCPQAIHYHTHTPLFTAMYRTHSLKMTVKHTHTTRRSHTHIHIYTCIQRHSLTHTQTCSWRHNTPNTLSECHSLSASGWQNLTAFRWEQNWPQKFRQVRICCFCNKCVVVARNCKFANLIQYDMQYIPRNSALFDQETLFLTQKSTFLPMHCRPKSA